MSYPGRHNIYEATIRRMVTQSLEEQEEQFRQAHLCDPEEELVKLLRDWVSVHGYTPWPGELAGGSFLAERFGSWEELLRRAGLPPPNHPNKPQSFPRIKAQTRQQKLIYSQRKAEKKQLAQRRLAEQAAKRRARENK